MASQSFMRNGMTSPARAMMKKSGSSRSILKRPTALPMSPQPFPYAASFSIHLSPPMKSPHVHFPSSPSLVATFVTHSPGSYDRGPIAVSPNPLALPSWGERIYSPSLEGFKLSAPPKPFRSLKFQDSPVITEFEDPRSPKLQPAAKQNAIRFSTFGNNQSVARPSKNLDKSIGSYPRSPYPSAPITPSEETADASDLEARGRALTRQWPKDREADDSAPARRARASSLDERKRNKKGLTIAARQTAGAFTPIPSPLVQSFMSPSVNSINRARKPAPLDLDAQAEEDEPMVTALEYPESAVEYEEKMDMAAAAPQIIYGGVDGVLWSPALPKPSATINKIRESLMSPAKQSSFNRIVRKDFTAPSPNDPFAAFPSFAATMQMGNIEGAITYPPRVVLEQRA
ncbi:hypothetical protein B0H34DRAFT_4003 [Crassisporium funariophilum]|nr:hypothetical protein B0H34DRAFT_4003 [Crassisporium funariophilum]